MPGANARLLRDSPSLKGRRRSRLALRTGARRDRHDHDPRCPRRAHHRRRACQRRSARRDVVPGRPPGRWSRGSASTTSAFATGRRCAKPSPARASRWRPARRWPSSVTPAPASRHARTCCCACRTPSRDRSRSGHDVRDFPQEDLRALLTLVPQDAYLFNVSLRENIRLGHPDATDAEVEAAARGALADEFITLLPDGYDTIAGELGARMSGGQLLRTRRPRLGTTLATRAQLEGKEALPSPSSAARVNCPDRLRRSDGCDSWRTRVGMS